MWVRGFVVSMGGVVHKILAWVWVKGGPRCFVKKVPLKVLQDLQENICGEVSCYIKLQAEDFQVY